MHSRDFVTATVHCSASKNLASQHRCEVALGFLRCLCCIASPWLAKSTTNATDNRLLWRAYACRPQVVVWAASTMRRRQEE